MRERIVMLGGTDRSTRMVWHALHRRFGDVPVILEAPANNWVRLARRAKTLGVRTTAGQVVFRTALVPVLNAAAARRRRDIVLEHRLDDSPITGEVIHVRTMNAPETREALRRLAPAVVAVSGTSIIGRETLGCVQAPFINTHAGITPFCRGVHGGYWALVDGRPDLVGTTVHLLDEGIDTGQVLAQATFRPGPEDSFVTYPLLHTAAGIPILLDVVAAALDARLATRPSLVPGPSRLRTHPTAWGYLWRRVTRGVR